MAVLNKKNYQLVLSMFGNQLMKYISASATRWSIWSYGEDKAGMEVVEAELCPKKDKRTGDNGRLWLFPFKVHHDPTEKKGHRTCG
jgi:hypothetical protein